MPITIDAVEKAYNPAVQGALLGNNYAIQRLEAQKKQCILHLASIATNILL